MSIWFVQRALRKRCDHRVKLFFEGIRDLSSNFPIFIRLFNLQSFGTYSLIGHRSPGIQPIIIQTSKLPLYNIFVIHMQYLISRTNFPTYVFQFGTVSQLLGNASYLDSPMFIAQFVCKPYTYQKNMLFFRNRHAVTFYESIYKQLCHGCMGTGF